MLHALTIAALVAMTIVAIIYLLAAVAGIATWLTELPKTSQAYYAENKWGVRIYVVWVIAAIIFLATD